MRVGFIGNESILNKLEGQWANDSRDGASNSVAVEFFRFQRSDIPLVSFIKRVDMVVLCADGEVNEVAYGRDGYYTFIFNYLEDYNKGNSSYLLIGRNALLGASLVKHYERSGRLLRMVDEQGFMKRLLYQLTGIGDALEDLKLNPISIDLKILCYKEPNSFSKTPALLFLVTIVLAITALIMYSNTYRYSFKLDEDISNCRETLRNLNETLSHQKVELSNLEKETREYQTQSNNENAKIFRKKLEAETLRNKTKELREMEKKIDIEIAEITTLNSPILESIKTLQDDMEEIEKKKKFVEETANKMKQQDITGNLHIALNEEINRLKLTMNELDEKLKGHNIDLKTKDIRLKDLKISKGKYRNEILEIEMKRENIERDIIELEMNKMQITMNQKEKTEKTEALKECISKNLKLIKIKEKELQSLELELIRIKGTGILLDNDRQ